MFCFCLVGRLFCFGGFGVFFLAETEHIFWEQHEYMETLGFFGVFFAINRLLKGIPNINGYCHFKGCFPVCVQYVVIIV